MIRHLISVLILSLLVLASPARGETIYRAGLVIGPGCYDNDALHLEGALLKGTNWKDGNTKAIAIRTREGLKDNVLSLLGKADEDDISLFYLCDHGSAEKDADADDPAGDSAEKKATYKCGGECDELVELIKEELKDDELDGLFSGIKGNKVIVIDACFSAGMQDGKKDLRPNTKDAIVVWSCKTNEKAQSTNIWHKEKEKTGHAKFTGFLTAGLADAGNGFARADADKNEMVTVQEWLSYASPKTTTANPKQHPGLDDSRESADPMKAAKKVIFKYTKSKIADHPELDEVGDQKEMCVGCCPELDSFPYSVARIELQTPGGTEQVVLRGPALITVELESLGDPDRNGREQVPAQLRLLELTGESRLLGPLFVRLRSFGPPSVGQIEERVNHTPGTLDVHPFAATGTAASSFDVFFEMEAPRALEGFMLLHNRSPKRLAALIRHKPPGTGETYQDPTPIQLFDEHGRETPIWIRSASHTPSPATCDANGDGRIDRNDISLVGKARKTRVLTGEPRDPDADGKITGNDTRICKRLCTKPRGCL